MEIKKVARNIILRKVNKVYRYYLRYLLDKYGIYSYRPTIKQSALFVEALHEMSIPHKGIRIDHNRALCFNGKDKYGVIFPKRYLDEVSGLSKEKIYKYCFIGKYTPFREWTKAYESDNSYIKFTDSGRRYSKGFFDKDYYQVMCNSEFTLCPKGDYLWTYRFYEAIMSSSIPIIEKGGIEPSMSDFIYYIHSEESSSPVYDRNICLQNYNLFLERHTLCNNFNGKQVSSHQLSS